MQALCAWAGACAAAKAASLTDSQKVANTTGIMPKKMPLWKAAFFGSSC
jgi:hypothetical protein